MRTLEVSPYGRAVHREIAMRKTLVVFIVLAWIVWRPITLNAAEPNALTEEDKKAGWKLLFDGKSLDGWQGATRLWAVEDAKLSYRPQRASEPLPGLAGRKLLSDRQYTDFILRFEFKLDKGSNSGVAIRAPLEGDAAFVGMEIQVIDNDGWRSKLKPYQVHGSIYGVVPAKTGHLKPAGEWNTQEILCQGRHVRVTLNGTVITDANLNEVRPIDGKEHPGLKRDKGYLGFLGHTDRVEFRSIRIKELPRLKR